MPPGSNKRKRPERQISQDDASGRPSPHRPENLGLAQQNQQHGGSRGGRGGNGGGGSSRRQSRQFAPSPVNGVNAVPVMPRSAASPTSTASQLAPVQRDSPAVEGSRPATPSQTSKGTSQQPADEATQVAPAPYLYECISDAVVSSWQESGKNSILDTTKEADDMMASTVVQELVRSALDGRLAAAEAGSVIREMISQHSDSEELGVQSLFLNSISLLEDSDMKSSKLLTLVSATDIDPNEIRQELDIPLLQALGLVRNTFTQIRTRKTTNILYRQANFNLLREETEGYAKLITEYFNTANESTSNDDVSAEAAFQRIKALVGSFDLDVGRVLDITLDISANLLVRAYRFIVRFYRCSSWWPDGGVLDNVKWEDQGFGSFPNWALPGIDDDLETAEEREERRREEKRDLALLKGTRDFPFWQRVRDVGMDAFFELGTRKIADFDTALPLLETELPPEYDAKGKEGNADRRKRINENRRYMKETGTLPPLSNSDAAQLLGFKLRFYASSARDAQDVLPENLIYLAALLIKIGFISLRDLYPHLYPADEKMSEEKTRLEKEKAEKEAKEKPGAGANALAMAGALTDDTLPVVRNLRAEKERSGANTPKPDKKDEEPIDELPTPANQKIMLLKALLLIGALPEALYILGRFPWLVDVDLSLPPYLHRIANQMLSKVASTVRPLADREGLQDAKGDLNEKSPIHDGIVPFKPREQKKLTRWLGLDQVDKSDGATYRHYYPEWDENIPMCQGVEDVFLLCNSFLGYLGVKIGQDTALLSTLLRIAKHSLREDSSELNRTRWLELMRRLLVPALSLSKHNVGLTQEVFELLMFFPTTTRYNIYAEWYLGKTSRLPDIRAAFDHNRAEVKDVLRRVTNETSRKQARALAKIAYSSPGVVVMNMVNQLESYSNMIPSLVECTRFFSPLAYDVLNWCLINSLSGRGRDRMQADGMLTSPWLQALSQFVASLFHKYTALNPAPVLQYLASELRDGNSTDLEMFEQLLAEMGGIRSDMEFNDAQVLAMAGGELMQAQTVQQLADKRYDRRKGTAQRLIKALEDPGLIGQTLIAVAQERQMYPYHDSSKDMPLKVLGNNLDKIQQVFAQYLEVLRTNLKPSDFEVAVPDIGSLVGECGLEPGIAFTICRLSIVHRIGEFDAAKKLEVDAKRRRSSQEQANGDVEMQDSKPTTSDASLEEGEAQETIEGTQDTIVDESKLALTPQPSSNAVADNESRPWHPVLEPIIQRLSEVATDLEQRVSMPFFVSFWTLTLQDILVHTASYTNEVSKLRSQLKEVSADRSDMTSSGLKRREEKKKQLLELQDKLQSECKGRIAVYQKTRNRISRQEKDHWFLRTWKQVDLDARHAALLQECFLPRAMLSSLDAHYCFLMLKMMHDNGTPGFSIMHIMNQLMKKHELATIMFQCTAMEAQHFGRFLCETLKLLQHWHADKATYEKEGLGDKQKLLGFAKILNADGDPDIVVGYEEYRRLLFNWHSFLNAALSVCFESGEFMHIRNGIIVLKSVVQVYPSLNFMGHGLVKQVTKISQEDSRQDLKLAAMSLLGPLRNREKQWMMPQAFRLNDASKEAGKSASRAPSAQPETPQPAIGTPKLNAAAPAFKPVPVNLTNGTARKESVAGKEDGEIEDEKPTTASDGDKVMKGTADTKQDAEMSQDEDAAKPDAKEVPGPARASTDSVQTKETSLAASKPPTPALVPSKPPPAAYEQSRADSSRPSSTQPRTTHALPSRPESRPPSSKPLPAPSASDQSGGRYASRGDDRYGRLDRPGDLRPGSRDHSPGRSRARIPERDPYYGPPGPNRGPLRDDRGPPRAPPEARHARDDSWLSSRPGPHSGSSHDSRDRPNGAMGPPLTQSAHADRAGYMSSTTSSSAFQQSSRPPPSAPQTSQASQGETTHQENPARLALINEDQSQTRDRSRDTTVPKDSRREVDGRDERPALVTRPSGGRPLESPRELPPRADQPSELAPTGPRRGRVSRDLGTQTAQESSYGRLNGPQDVATVSRAPNGPSGRGGRNLTAPQPPAAVSTRSNEASVSSTTTDTRPPESPASFRGPPPRRGPDRRNSGAQFERQTPSNSVPTTPATEGGPPVHPSRMNQVGVQPAPIQTNNLPADSSRIAASPTSAPPSGPRGPNRPSGGVPTGPSPTSANPPSGPASAVERQRRGDRQRASINATLQGVGGTATGPNGQNVSFRGVAAQNRQPEPPAPSSATNVAPVQAIASSIEPPPTRRSESAAAQRQDGPPSRPEAQPDLMRQGRRDDNNDRRMTGRREDDRPERQRSTRNQYQDQRSGNEPPNRPFSGMEDPADKRMGSRRPREERETREGPPREARGHERPPRDDVGGPPPRAPPPNAFPGPPPEWERGGGSGREQRRDGMDDSRRGGRGGGRPEDFRGGRREDERRGPSRDEGPPPPGGRKRRHEETSYDDTKRRRGGR